MLIIVCDLIPWSFSFCVVGGQGLVEDLVGRPASDRRCSRSHSAPSGSGLYSPPKAPVVVSDTSRPVMPDMVAPIKSPIPFYRPNLLQPSSTKTPSLLLSPGSRSFSPPPRWGISMSACAPAGLPGAAEDSNNRISRPRTGHQPAAYGHSPRGHQFTAGPYFLILSRHLNIKFMLSRCYGRMSGPSYLQSHKWR